MIKLEYNEVKLTCWDINYIMNLAVSLAHLTYCLLQNKLTVGSVIGSRLVSPFEVTRLTSE